MPLGSAGQELPQNALIVHVGDEVGTERYLRDCRRSAHIVRTLVQTRTDAYRGFELEDSHGENCCGTSAIIPPTTGTNPQAREGLSAGHRPILHHHRQSVQQDLQSLHNLIQFNAAGFD